MILSHLHRPFLAESGFAFCLEVPSAFRDLGPNVRIFLYEDDRLIGSEESPHAKIRQDGRGNFSIWGGTLYLSTSDNSDPNINGRHYCLVGVDVSIDGPIFSSFARDLASNDQVVMQAVIDNSTVNNTVFSNFFRYHETILMPLEREGIALPQSILEVGCGALPIAALRFLAEGVKRYIANDISPVNRTFDKTFARSLIKCTEIFDATLANNLAQILNETEDGYGATGLIVLDQIPCEEIVLEAPVDLISSTSVLEHVAKPSEAVAAFHRLLAPRGFMWHSIDLRDHRDFSRPLDFLYRSRGPYAENTENRLRKSDWVALFEDGGFEVIEEKNLMLTLSQHQVWTTGEVNVEPAFTEAHRKLFEPPFDTYDLGDLSTIAVQILCRKQ